MVMKLNEMFISYRDYRSHSLGWPYYVIYKYELYCSFNTTLIN